MLNEFNFMGLNTWQYISHLFNISKLIGVENVRFVHKMHSCRKIWNKFEPWVTIIPGNLTIKGANCMV